MIERVGARARLSFSNGFTMVELLLVIVVIGLLGIAVLPVFLDFRYEARIATSQNYINNLVSAIAMKKSQIMLRCNQSNTVWPRLEAIQMNDVTEGGASSAHCTIQQIPNLEDRKFMEREVELPPNPWNERIDILPTTCTNLCTCMDEGGYLYNAQTGAFGHPQVLHECLDIAQLSTSSSTSTSESASASSSSDNSGTTSSSSSSSEEEEEVTTSSEPECSGSYTGISPERYDIIDGQCYSAARCNATGEEFHPGFPGSPNDYSNCVSSGGSSSEDLTGCDPCSCSADGGDYAACNGTTNTTYCNHNGAYTSHGNFVQVACGSSSSGVCTPSNTYVWESGTYWPSGTGCVRHWNNCDGSGQQSSGANPGSCGYTCTCTVPSCMGDGVAMHTAEGTCTNN